MFIEHEKYFNVDYFELFSLKSPIEHVAQYIVLELAIEESFQHNFTVLANSVFYFVVNSLVIVTLLCDTSHEARLR